MDDGIERPKLMDKNLKNYLKIQNKEDLSISNIGNEYY